MNRNFLRPVTLVFHFALSLASVMAIGAEPALDDYIASLDPLELMIREFAPLESEKFNQGTRTCTRSKVPIDDILTSYSASLTSGGDALWPGALIQGLGLYEGRLDQVLVKRAPLTIVMKQLQGKPLPTRPNLFLSPENELSLSGISGLPTASYQRTLPVPNSGNAEDAIRSLVKMHGEKRYPAEVQYSVYAFKTAEEAALRLGFAGGYAGFGSMSAAFNKKDFEEKDNYVVRFRQIYYRVSAVEPTSIRGYIDPTVTIANLKPFTTGRVIKGHGGKPNPPAYVSTVAYGRQLYLIASAASGTNNVESSIRASISFGFAHANASWDTSSKRTWEQSNIQAWAIGGDPSKAIEPIKGDPKSIASYFENGASDPGLGLPIDFAVRFLNGMEGRTRHVAERREITCGSDREMRRAPTHNHRGPPNTVYKDRIVLNPGERVISVHWKCSGRACGFCYPINRKRVPRGYGADWYFEPQNRTLVIQRHCDGGPIGFSHDYVIEKK